jgi:O-methyltransferase
MAEFTIHHGDPFEAYSLSDRHVIVDVGGGRGDLIAWALRSNLGLRGIVYDLPQGITETVHTLASWGVSDRCQIVTGSFFNSIPDCGDVYVMSRVLHDWTDEKAKQILTNCRKAIRDDGVLLLRESVISEGDAPSAGKQMDLTMLFLEGGRERTEREWQSLLKETGFSLKRVIKAKRGPFDIIEATPT